MLATPDRVNFSDAGARLACCAPPRALVCRTRVDSNHPPPHILIHHPHRRHTPTDYPGEYGKSYYRSFDQLTYLFSQFLTILRTTFVVVCWVVMRLIVEPLEALVSDFSASSAGAYLRRCEQTAGTASSSSLCAFGFRQMRTAKRLTAHFRCTFASLTRGSPRALWRRK